MDQLVDSLMEELNCNTVFTIPLFGGIDVLESVVVTWIIMAIIMIGSLIWVHGLKIRKIVSNVFAYEKSLGKFCSILSFSNTFCSENSTCTAVTVSDSSVSSGISYSDNNRIGISFPCKKVDT